jgi:hypothetical protein
LECCNPEPNNYNNNVAPKGKGHETDEEEDDDNNDDEGGCKGRVYLRVCTGSQNALNKWVCLIQNPNSIFCNYLGWDAKEILEILGTGDCRCSDPQVKKG